MRFPVFLNFQTKWLKIDYLLVALIGLLFLAISYQMLYKGATLSDEVVYAVVARNFFEKGTLNTNLYRADSIIARGYPTRDVHVPGYMITLAAAFGLFGVNEFALGLPSQIAYVLTGLILYRIGKSLFKPSIAMLATFLFYIHPINFVFASLVMVESSLNLLAVIYIAFWLKISRVAIPGLLEIIILAVLLVIGMLYRQTFIIFLLPTLFVLFKSSLTHRNYRPLIVFSLLFLVLLFSLYWPLAQNRAYYPSAFDKAVEAEQWTTKIDIIGRNLLNNLSPTAVPFDAYYFIAWINLLLGVLISVLNLKYLDRSHRSFTIFFLYLFWVSLFMLTIFHAPIFDLATSRNIIAFLLPGFLLLAALIFSLKQLFARSAAIIVIIILLGVSSLYTTQAMAWYQAKTINYQQRVSSAIAKYLKPYAPQTIMSYKTFTAAWDHYPIEIVWSPPTTYDELQSLEERLPIDAIVVGNERDRDIILDASAAGLLKQRYISLFSYKVEGFYFLINEHLQLQTHDHAQ